MTTISSLASRAQTRAHDNIRKTVVRLTLSVLLQCCSTFFFLTFQQRNIFFSALPNSHPLHSLSGATKEVMQSTAKSLCRIGSVYREKVYERAWSKAVLMSRKEAVKFANLAANNFNSLVDYDMQTISNQDPTTTIPSINCFALSFIVVKVS